MPNRRHSSRRFTPSCSNNITNSCRCDMIDCSDHGTPAPPPQANNADTMRQPCPRTPVHYLSRPYTFRGEREGPIAARWEGEVGNAAEQHVGPPPPRLPPPPRRGGSESGVVARGSTRSQTARP